MTQIIAVRPFLHRALAAAGVLAAAFIGAVPCQAEDWPHWRGASRNDVLRENSGWTNGHWFNETPVWSREVGEGSTSPLVIGTNLYVMGWSDDQDHLQCLSSSTGATAWQVSYSAPRYPRYAAGDKEVYGGPIATPEYDAETSYLYTLGTDGALNGWNTRDRGRLVWSTNLYDAFHVPQRPAVKWADDDLRDYGYTTSPFVYGDDVIVEVGASNGVVMAFARRTGQLRWRSEATGFAGHSGGLTPITVESVPCLAVLTYDGLLVLRIDPGHEGKTVATYPWKSAYANNVLTPTAKDDCILLSGFHSHQSVCKLKITLHGAEKLWEARCYSAVGSPMVAGDRVYLTGDRLYCLDWQTGKIIWMGGSFGTGGATMAAADGNLIVWSDRGKATLVAGATLSPDKYLELARLSRLVAAYQSWPHPVLANGPLFCKDRFGKLICLGPPAK
jgi:outer membrane protein assembly factor BamB